MIQRPIPRGNEVFWGDISPRSPGICASVWTCVRSISHWGSETVTAVCTVPYVHLATWGSDTHYQAGGRAKVDRKSADRMGLTDS